MTTGWRRPFTPNEMQAMRAEMRDEDKLGFDFWALLRRIGRNLPFAEDAIAAFYCAFDPATSPRVKAILIGALAYLVLPFDAIPDMLPLIGFGDDAAVLATAIASVRGAITPEHRARARAALDALA